ncbi:MULTISPECIES: HEAT repeat domain-containing protein [unclassified Bradyrhizobium]
MTAFEPFEGFGDLDEISERLQSPDPSVRRLAVIELVETSTDEAVPLLARSAGDADAGGRLQAARAWGDFDGVDVARVRGVEHDLLAFDPDVAKVRRSGRRQALAEPVPIIDQLDTVALDWEDRGPAGAGRIGGADQDVVGIQGSGAVIFGAVQDVAVISVRRECRAGGDITDARGSELGRSEPDDGALGDGPLPVPALFVPGLTYQPFDDAEMVAQDMRHIGVGLAQANDDREEIADRAAGAAGGHRQPQCAETRALDEVDRVERKNAVAFPRARAFSDLIEHRVQFRRIRSERLRGS